MNMKLLVIGFDGATFDLIEPFSKKGILPHISRLIAQGVSTPLISVIPPVSAPAWTSLVTGKNPGKHNIYGFQDKDGRVVNSTFRKSKALWNLLDEHGKRSIAINIPMTSPPERINGIIKSGILTPHERGFSGRFQIDKESLMEKEKALPKMFQWEINQTEKALKILKKEKWDLFFTVYHLSDFVPTIYWNYMDKTHPHYRADDTLSTAVEDAYKVLDDILGRYLSCVDSQTCVVVVSDHGMGPSKKVFNINEWLRREGFLDIRTLTFEKVLSPEKVTGLIKHHAIIKRFVLLLPDFLQKKGYKMVFSRSKDVLSRIHPESRAYAFSHAHFASIWLRKKCDGTLAEIEKRIQDLKDPDTGEPIITRVYRKDQLFHGPWVDNAPDLIVEAIPHYSIRSQRIGTLFSEPLQSGDHRMNGIFIASGPPVKTGILKEHSIFDVCPTLLTLLGLPVPSDMDGCVMNIFKKEVPIKEAEESQIEYHQKVYSKEEEETIRERLSALGYFD
ncbi:MAG: alkaline phosphatase family protein [Theionarchaea archaeon]|nr:alkaline phosphatase family protein [Theionarchaea archaeon]MBU7037512.1 alkaline phosphatase family protein [Theionarchaea archaeon]